MAKPKRLLIPLAILAVIVVAFAVAPLFAVTHHTVTIDLSKTKLFICFAPKGEHLTVATAYANASTQKPVLVCNGPIFAPGYRPLGLLVIDGKQLHPLNRQKGAGNFFIQPNGVFFISAGKALILDTNEYVEKERGPTLAFQSGPLLVADGTVPAAITKLSGAKYRRSAIGILANGRVAIVHTETRLTLAAFAAYLADTAKLKHALYLDGAVCGYKTPEGAQNADQPLSMVITAIPKAPAP